MRHYVKPHLSMLLAFVLSMHLSAAQAPQPSEDVDCCSVTMQVELPNDVDSVYITGNQETLGFWQPDGLLLEGDGEIRFARFQVPLGTQLEYKFTLGTWDRQALDEAGPIPPNFTLLVNGNQTVDHKIHAFQPDPMVYFDDWQGSGVQGTLVYWRDVESAFLSRSRHVVIWLPPSYDAARQYPVLYMHDGQNLFDPRLKMDGEIWDVDDAVVRLVDSGRIEPIIVVGVFSSANRLDEYSPWHRAPDYANFLIEELMPRVNDTFSTLTGAENTAVMGSSMGGLLSYYLVTYHPETFGACGCISSHFPLSQAMVERYLPGSSKAENPDETPYIIHDIEQGLTLPEGARYWFDYGTKGTDAAYHGPHKAIFEWLKRQGLTEGEDFVLRVYEGADHNEASWRERLEDPLRFLFGERG